MYISDLISGFSPNYSKSQRLIHRPNFSIFLTFIAACIFCLNIASAANSQDTLKAEISERRTLLLGFLARMQVAFATAPVSHSEAALQRSYGPNAYMPDGMLAATQENHALVLKALEALHVDKPMTLEALHEFSRETEAGLQAAMALQVVVNLSGIQKAFAEHRADPENNYKPEHTSVLVYDSPINETSLLPEISLRNLSVTDARNFLDETVPLRFPELKVRFRLGGVSILAEDARNRETDAEQAASDARSELEAAQRAIVRLEANVERQLDLYNAAAKPIQQRLAARISALGEDDAGIANEQRLTLIELRSLAGAHLSAETVLADARSKLPPLLEILAAAEQKALEERYAGLPQILSIETDHARIVSGDNYQDEMTQILELLRNYSYHQAELYAQRKATVAALEEAVEYARETNNDLKNFTYGSYTLQAFAQAAVQITDAAVASKGDPLTFATVGIFQAVSNVFVSKPTFYETELGADGNVTARADGERTAINTAVGQSVLTTISKSGITELNEQIGGRVSREAAIEAAEGLVGEQTRRVISRSISQDLESFAKFKGGNLVTSIIEGLAIDAATEGAKQLIAREMTEGAMRAFADAQISVASLTFLLGQIYKIEEMDTITIAGLEKRRADLLEERARLLPGLEHVRPALTYERNDEFEIEASTEIRVELSPNAPPYDLFIQGAKAEPTDRAGVFQVGDAVIAELAEGSPMRLTIEIRLR